MTAQNVRKMLFMLFEEGLMNEVIKVYNDYKYIIRDESLNILVNVAKAYTLNTSKNKQELDTIIQEILKSNPTEEFPDLKALCSKIYKDSNFEVPKNLKTNNETFYKSPELKIVSINGTSYEDTINLENLLRKYIKDKVIFRENVERVKDKWYKNHLKLIHAVETNDFEYGLKNSEFFLNFDKMPNVVLNEQLAPYLILIELLEAKQKLNPNIKIYETQEYKKLETILQDTKCALNLAYIKHWTLSKLDFLKCIADIKKHLIKIGYSENEIEDYTSEFLRF